MPILQTNRQKATVFVIGVYVLTIYTLWNTFRQSHSFLQWSIKLNQGFSFIIICAFTLMNFLLLWQGATNLLFGELRIIEQEHVFERLPLIVISIIMITSSFSSDQIFNVLIFSTGFLVMQVFTWILKDRLEGLLQTINGETTLTKLVFSNFIRNMIIFAILNYFTTKHTFFDTLKPFYHDLNNTNIALLIFGYNFTSILIQYLNILAHTILNLYAFYYTQSPHRRNNQVNGDDDDDDDEEEEKDFEGKFIYEKCINFTTKLLDVILDFTLLIPFKFKTFYAKDLIWDLILLIKMGVDLFKIWQNNKKLGDKLPDIIADDLIGHDNICIVCMDDLVDLSHEKKHEIGVDNDNSEEIIYTQDDINAMSKHKRPKILPCGHMLHFACLKHWMERSQTCPTCRLNVFDDKGNVKPVKHHHPPAGPHQPETRSTRPTPTPTQPQSQDASRPVSSDPNTFSSPDNSTTSLATGSDAHTTTTSARTGSSRAGQSPDLMGNKPYKPTRPGEWGTFAVQDQSSDGYTMTFQVKDGESRTQNVELVLTPNKDYDDPYITINNSCFENVEFLD